MRKAVFSFLAFLLFMAFAARSGFYPVALVEGTLIWKRSWRTAEEASRRFLAAKIYEAEKVVFDFSSPENQPILRDIKKDTLTFLIEDVVLERGGSELLPDFKELTKKRVDGVFAERPDTSEAALVLYGLDGQGFEKLVLIPQARIDVLKDALGNEFDLWFSEAKKKANVQLLLLPYRWDREMIR